VDNKRSKNPMILEKFTTAVETQFKRYLKKTFLVDVKSINKKKEKLKVI
jgi:hypothetical protein